MSWCYARGWHYELPNVSLSVFRDLRNNSLDSKNLPADAFSELKNLKEMWVLLTTRVSFAWKLYGVSLYYLVPRFPTSTFDVGSRLSAITSECVVTENIHNIPPPPHTHTHTHKRTPGNGNSGGDPKGGNFWGGGGGGVASREFFCGLRVRSMSC